MVKPLWKAEWSYFKKIKNGSAFRPSNPISGNISEGTQNTNLKEYKHPYVHCSVTKIAKIWEQPKCPSVHERIKQLWDIYTIEHFSVIKKKKILPFVTVWMDLENIMLSEISPSETDKCCIISLICGI